MRIIAPLIMFTLVIGFCIMAVAVPSCSGVDCKNPKNASTASCSVQQVLTDCTGSDTADVIAKYGPVVTDTIEHARKPDGSIDWASIASTIEDQTIKFGWCVVADVFSKYVFVKPLAAVGGSGSASAPTSAPAPAKAAFDELRTKRLAGHQFKTSGGTL